MISPVNPGHPQDRPTVVATAVVRPTVVATTAIDTTTVNGPTVVATAAMLQQADGAPVRVRLLGEDLIAFRDSEGAVGLVDAFCPHRRAPLFFGRNEECGIRCVYHGWKFDRHGNCTDMPSEPEGTPLQARVKLNAYPTHEAGGLVWAYLGPKHPTPEPPAYEWLRAPATHKYVSKTFQHNSYLQGLEGGLDIPRSTRATQRALAKPVDVWELNTEAEKLSQYEEFVGGGSGPA